MRLLVTGGAGFIGSHFIRYEIINHPEDMIVNYDLLTYASNLNNLSDISTHPSYYFVHGNICDRKLVEKVIERYKLDVIVNFAAESHVDRSIVDSDLFIKTNIVGTQTLLEAARALDVKKYVQISTDEVYGSAERGKRFKEDSLLQPSSPYSASKASADLLALSFAKTYGMNVMITRCSNNFGPCQFPEKLIPLMTTNAIAGKDLPVYGDGQNIRDWLYVDDHCSAIDAVLQGGGSGEIYNISGHNEKRNIDIVKLIVDRLRKSKDLIKFVADRPGMIAIMQSIQ